jgi:hypothetical protein
MKDKNEKLAFYKVDTESICIPFHLPHEQDRLLPRAVLPIRHCA